MFTSVYPLEEENI